jgi:hypothetical protein
MLEGLKRRWVWVIAAAALAALAGVAAAHRLTSPKMPGVCVKEIVPFCADPSWPDAD